MKFTQVFTLGLFALSTQAAAIPQESTTEQSKRLDADVAAQLAGNILNLIQLGAGAEISASTKRDESAVDTVEESKRLDADVAAQIAANILNLIQLGIGADVNVSAKREDTVAAQIGANILNLIQAAVGAQTTVDL